MSNKYVLVVDSFTDPDKYVPVLEGLFSDRKRVCVGLEEIDADKSDPFAWAKRSSEIKALFDSEYSMGKLIIVSIPAIASAKILE